MSFYSFSSHEDLEQFAEFLNVDYDTFYEAYYGLSSEEEEEFEELLQMVY